MKIKQTKTYAKWFDGLKDRQAKMRIDRRVKKASRGDYGDVKPVEAAACDGLAAYLRATAKATMAASSPVRRKTAKRGLVKA